MTSLPASPVAKSVMVTTGRLISDSGSGIFSYLHKDFHKISQLSLDKIYMQTGNRSSAKQCLKLSMKALYLPDPSWELQSRLLEVIKYPITFMIQVPPHLG